MSNDSRRKAGRGVAGRRPFAIISTCAATIALSAAAFNVSAADFNIASGDVVGLAAAIVQANANGECLNRIFLPSGIWTATQVWGGVDAVSNTALPIVDLARSPCSFSNFGGRTLEIHGAGMGQTIIERDPGAPRMRFFAVTPGGFGGGPAGIVPSGLMLSDLTLRGGNLFPRSVSEFCCNAGAITVDSSDLSLTRVALLNNRAVQGGAVEVQTGRLFINQSSLEGNTSARQGGAVYGSGFLRVDRSTISNNVAGAQLVPDSGGQGGGAVLWRNDSRGEILDSSVVSNRIAFNVRSGGAIHSSGPLDIVRTELRGNEASGDGGAVYCELGGGPFAILNSTLSGNFAAGRGSALACGPAGSPEAVFLESVTIASNEAPASGSAISAAPVFANNTLIAATRMRGFTTAAPNCNNDSVFDGSGSYNLDSDGTCRLSGSGDFSVFNAADVVDLSARANGGSTMTHALVRSGLAVDRTPAGCSSPDQRGVQRPQDGNGDGVARCDTGAFELQPLGDVAFSALDVRAVLTRQSAQNDIVRVNGSFALSSGSDGLDPLTQTLRITLTDINGIVFTHTLSPGSFQRNQAGQYVYRAGAGASGLTAANVEPGAKPGEFVFRLTAQRLSLPLALGATLDVSLGIGNDSGTARVACRVSPGAAQCK